ncbi:MAG TPA: hypothetical protein VGB50_06575 [Flavobacterium sp.]|jgi:hypothetical protein
MTEEIYTISSNNIEVVKLERYRCWVCIRLGKTKEHIHRTDAICASIRNKHLYLYIEENMKMIPVLAGVPIALIKLNDTSFYSERQLENTLGLLMCKFYLPEDIDLSQMHKLDLAKYRTAARR